MKRFNVLCATALLLLASPNLYAQPVKQVSNNTSLRLQGAFLMQKQVLDSGLGPHVLPVRQMKIFTDKYVMYAHRRSETDSLAEFGIGTYTIQNGKVIENMFHTSSGAANNTFDLSITRKDNGYTQVIQFPGNGKQYILTEEYAEASRDVLTPLDGAWSLTSFTTVDQNGKSTTFNRSDNAKQFKLYQSGHFMWARYYKEMPSGRLFPAYGYGTFSVSPSNQLTETNESSTYATMLNGVTIVQKIRFDGKDKYEQTFEETDGSKRIERYERLK